MRAAAAMAASVAANVFDIRAPSSIDSTPFARPGVQCGPSEGSLTGGSLMRTVCTMLCALLAGTVSVAAHHSFAAEYDGEKPVTVTGVVARIDWMNPHIYFYVDV